MPPGRYGEPVAGAQVSDDGLAAFWHSVTVGVARTQRRVDALVAESGVPAQWFAVLQLLLQADGHRLPMSVLARDVAMTSGGFTKLADRMAREGLIDRRGSMDDGRVVHATLTAEGLAMAAQAAVRYRDALRECLGSLSADALASTGATMGTLAESGDLPAAEQPETEQALPRDPSLPDRRRR